MSNRVMSLEYRDAHYRMISGLEGGVKRPKLVIGKTKSCTRGMMVVSCQPIGQRSAKWGLG